MTAREWIHYRVDWDKVILSTLLALVVLGSVAAFFVILNMANHVGCR